MNLNRIAIVLVTTALMFGISAPTAHAAPRKPNEKPPVPDFTKGDKPDESHAWTLGATGARGWLYTWAGNSSESRQILVTDVAKGSPADGVLQVGDVILGVDSKNFDSDARIQFAKAIAHAETQQSGGKLSVQRWREGKTENITLQLQVMGTYSHTAPYDCPKSAKIFEQGCEAIAKRGLKGVSIPNNLNALALLASGEEKYRPMLAAYAQEASNYSTESMATWHYGYTGMFLAEYIIATGDTSVMPGLERIVGEAVRGQSAVGTWGHKFARPDGNLNGYGCMNQPGLSLTIAMILARDAGAKVPSLDTAIARSAGFLRWFVDKGAIPYGDHKPFPDHEDNGKCSSGTVLFDLLDDAEAASFFSKMATAAYDERERGHTGNFFNITWAMLGVSRSGPLATGAYLNEQSWYYDLARKWDGSFDYQGSPVGAEEHGKYTKWDSTGAYLLAYALPRKSLHLTGKHPTRVKPLDQKQVDEVIAAGRGFFPIRPRTAYEQQTDDQLVAGLASWSPTVRNRSAQALSTRDGSALVTKLTQMLKSPVQSTRYGALEGLAALGPKADPAAAEIKACLTDKDPWTQCLAANAVLYLSPETRKAFVDDLLNMILTSNPNDPRKMSQRAAAIALFSLSPGSRGPETILASSFDGVNRDLLRPAIKSLLQNEDSIVRGAVGRRFGNLSHDDLVVLLPDIIKATQKLAPSNEMFGDGVRGSGLELLSKLHIREGLPMCIEFIEPDRWGAGNRLTKAAECIARYGAHAKAYLPQLEAMRTKSDKGNEVLDKLIAQLQGATDEPTLISLDDFMSQPAPSK